MRNLVRASVLLATVASLSCDREKPRERSAAPNAALGGQIAARVGDEAVPLAVVASVAGAQHVDARTAALRVVDDAIAASAARQRGLDQRRPASWLLVAARGRFAADQIFREAKGRGAPTNLEVENFSNAHWREVDRPAGVRVVHVVVLRPQKGGDAAFARARAGAAELRRILVTATSPEDFEQKAIAFPKSPDVETKFEKLPSFTDDGWAIERDARFSEKFSRPAFALSTPGETSDVVESEHGWHVIRLVEHLPEMRLPFETRREMFVDEVNAYRAHELLRERLEALRGRYPVTVSPASAEMMRSAMTESSKERGPKP